jgi:hypothetical protein
MKGELLIMKTEFKLEILPDWNEIHNVYSAVHNFFSSCSLQYDDIDMFTMITCELAENSIKYGDYKKDDKAIEINVKVMNKKIIIIVKNPVGETSKPYLHELDKTIQWARGFQDPYEAYIKRMRQISMEPFDNDKSGLGIVRIFYEGRAIIDFFINEKKILNVSAVTNAK